MSDNKQNLYEAVGGLPTLQKVHKIFYNKVYAHDWLKQFFEGFNQQIIEDKQTSFMGEKMGGPRYLGKPLKQVHENMYISSELFELRHRLLQESLEEANVDPKLSDRWLRIDNAFMKQVHKPSMQTFYRDYQFPYKRRIIIPRPDSDTENNELASS
ncbi:group I truncated hemoglobin [Kaarinaea lacus]